MPTPKGPVLYAGVMSRLPGEFGKGHGPLNDFVKNLCNDIANAWLIWNAGLLGGSNNVSGAGIGAFVGVGSGGGLKETAPMNVIHTWPNSDPDGYWNTFKAAITADYKEKFARYADSFKFGPVPYTGTSGALPPAPPFPGAPGPISAINTPGPLAGYKASATYPDDLADGIRGKLPGFWGKHPEPLNKWLKALEGSTMEQFKIWESTSMLIGDTFNGTGAPPAGAGSGTSDQTGKVV